jgi:hypothetical protein
MAQCTFVMWNFYTANPKIPAFHQLVEIDTLTNT